MPLILGRKAGQKIVITIDPSADPQELLRALQADGIEITVKDIGDHGTQVRLMVEAPRELLVLREELAECRDASNNREQCADGRLDRNNDGVSCESLWR